MSNQNTQKQIVELIKKSQNILVLPSAPADGDCLGSAVSLYLSLKKLNKDVTVVCADTVPDLLQFLPNIKVVGDKLVSSTDFVITLDCQNAKVDSIKSFLDGDRINIIITPKSGRLTERDVFFNKGTLNFDLIITVDTAELTQLKGIYENNPEIFYQIPVINIDHHISNTHFGKINYVDIMASSTTELLFPLLQELGRSEGQELIDEDIATLLLTGIITDTGSFQNANTTPKSFEVSADLIALGARQQEIIQQIYKTKQLSQLKLWGRVLSKIQTDEAYKIVWSAVSQQDFKDTESSEDQTGDIIDELMTNAPGAEIIFLMKEKKDGTATVSMRTTSSAIDASKIAENFGGGGHTQAAGFRFDKMSLRDAENKLIEYLREFQGKRFDAHVSPETDDKPQTPAEPMIDVQGLMDKAQEADKLNNSLRQPSEDMKVIYKFED